MAVAELKRHRRMEVGPAATFYAETDVDRTNAAGKASSVQFIHVPMTAQQAAAFKAPGAEVIVGIGHEANAHMAIAAEPVRVSLARDFD